jgi:hypothetical protein
MGFGVKNLSFNFPTVTEIQANRTTHSLILFFKKKIKMDYMSSVLVANKKNKDPFS